MEHEAGGEQIADGAFGTVPKGLERGLEKLENEQADTIQTTPLLKSTRILRRVLVTWADLLSHRI